MLVPAWRRISPRGCRKTPQSMMARQAKTNPCEGGIDISVVQVNALLSDANDVYLIEKDQLLVTGL